MRYRDACHRVSVAYPVKRGWTRMLRAARKIGVIALLVFSVTCLLNVADVRPQLEQRIEIVIRDSEFVLTQPAAFGFEVPTVIIVRNQDIIEHGFTSDILSGIMVKAEGEGITAYGKGIKGFHIKPGSTLVIRFTPTRPGEYHFHCDLHPEMKGEIFLFELGKV